MKKSTKQAWLAICVVVIMEYSPAAEDISEYLGPGDSSSALKAIHSDRIRAIMRRLNSLAYEREYTALELEQLRTEKLQSLAMAAEDLVLSGQRLPDITTTVALTEEEQAAFQGLALELRSLTLQLREEAKANNYAGLRLRYRQMRRTCASCHALFRGR